MALDKYFALRKLKISFLEVFPKEFNLSKKNKIIVWVVIGLLVVAVIAIVLATTLDRGSAIESSTFIRYASNYEYAVKDEKNEVSVSNGKVVLDYNGQDLDGNGSPDPSQTVDANTVIVRVEINVASIVRCFVCLAWLIVAA